MAQENGSGYVTMPGNVQGTRPVIVNDPTTEYVPVYGYGLNNSLRLLASTLDEVERIVDLETYETMENDPTVIKSKKILVTKALADELQFAPGSTEHAVGENEYDVYVGVMEFCQRVIAGLERPYRETLEQLLGNAIRYGHGIAEIEWNYREDGPSTKPSDAGDKARKSRLGALFGFSWLSSSHSADEQPKPLKKPALRQQKIRLMPQSIKVKPRGAARFVVDDYMNVLGLAPRYRGRDLRTDEVVSREKFLVLTLNKQDEDPRGKSSYRPAYNYWNLKQNIPAEVLRYILEESVPKPVFTLPEDGQPFDYVRDANGEVVMQNDGKTPKMIPLVDSARAAVTGMRSGSGAVIPPKAKLEPYKKSSNQDADFFGKIMNMIDRQIEFAILLQNLAQSEGEHQARSAAEVHNDILDILIFWLRWGLATMTITDLLENAVEKNLGTWALRYMPFCSLGDFVRRDWAKDLETVAKAYFYGFLDDTQRAELMAWLNLPRPGPSRQQVLAEADMNGEPGMPPENRPDKQPGNKNRNRGNGTEKNKNANGVSDTTPSGLGLSRTLGYHGNRAIRSAKAVLYGG